MYNRESVFNYAEKWAMGRNPQYYNFDSVGGDCTNFASQCIYAGCEQMNYTNTYGWYYITGNNKSPSWTGVEFLHNFLVNNLSEIGPRGEEKEIFDLEVGDIIQISFDGIVFSHSLVVVQEGINEFDTLVAAHTYDVWKKRLAEYGFKEYRGIHILTE